MLHGLANFETVKHLLFDTADLNTEHADRQREMSVVAGMMQQCVDENTCVAQNQDAYHQRYEGLVKRFENVKHRFEEIGNLLADIQDQREAVEVFIDKLRKQSSLISGFDEQLWYCFVDYATVYSKDDVKFTFKDRTVISTNICIAKNEMKCNIGAQLNSITKS